MLPPDDSFMAVGLAIEHSTDPPADVIADPVLAFNVATSIDAPLEASSITLSAAPAMSTLAPLEAVMAPDPATTYFMSIDAPLDAVIVNGFEPNSNESTTSTIAPDDTLNTLMPGDFTLM